MKNNKRHVRLDHDSSERVKRLKRSINQVRWYRTLVQLFWSAGPVTALGLIGGYYIGYGVLPPVELMLYFISFSVLSGIIGLFVKIGYDTTRGHVEEQDEQTIIKVADILGDLLLEVGDVQVQSYEGKPRQREAALQLLRRIDLTSYGVSVAFTHLTDDEATGRLMAELHAYRRAGLHIRAADLYEAHREDVEQRVQQLRSTSPQAAKMLEERFKGITSGSFRQGVEREEHFLQRVMSASEQNNPLLMTFRDVEEMIALAFELICGREIPILVFTYSGRWKFARLLDRLEEKRSKYRIAQAKGGNRIWAVAAYLREGGLINKDEIPKGLPIQQLTREVIKVMDQLSADLRRLLSVMDGSTDEEAIARYYRVFHTAFELYEMAHKGNIEIARRHTELIEAAEEWDKLMQQPSFESQNRLLRLGPGKKRGLHIKENVVLLSEEQRIEVCRHMLWYFEREGMTDAGSKLSWLRYGGPAAYEAKTEGARRLALELAVALEPHVRLSRPEIYRNVNATKATYLGELTPDLTGIQKMEIGRRGAQAATSGLDGSAEGLAKALVRIYHLTLDAEAVDFLHQTYGARKEMLNGLLKESENQEQAYPSSLLAERPPVVPKPKVHWQRLLRNLNKDTAARRLKLDK